eukprot:1188657-Prorocentrum_minimum.AAC.7
MRTYRPFVFAPRSAPVLTTARVHTTPRGATRRRGAKTSLNVVVGENFTRAGTLTGRRRRRTSRSASSGESSSTCGGACSGCRTWLCPPPAKRRSCSRCRRPSPRTRGLTRRHRRSAMARTR